MIVQNPKNEFTVNFSIEKVKEAVSKLENNSCTIIKNDSVLNEIVFHDKEKLGVGYHVSFTLNKKSENDTAVTIEVSRNLTTLNTSAEVAIANNKLKRFTNELSAILSGDTNPKTGKANIPKQGCILILITQI